MNEEEMKKTLTDFFRNTLHDPYSAYSSSEKNKTMAAISHDRGFGLGVELIDNHQQVLVNPYKDGPAYVAGFHDNAYTMVSLDGTPVTQINDITAMDGKMPSKNIQVSLRSNVSGVTETHTIIPGPYIMASVENRFFGEYSVLRIRTFKKSITTKEIKNAVVAMESLKQSKDSALIIDLRGCDGGNLHEAIEAAGLFLKPDVTIVTSFDSLNIKTVYRSPTVNVPITNRPLLLLVDEQTASAAEVFVAALSYNGNATTVGATTSPCVRIVVASNFKKK